MRLVKDAPPKKMATKQHTARNAARERGGEEGGDCCALSPLHQNLPNADELAILMCENHLLVDQIG